MEAAEQTVSLTEAQRGGTVVRVDAGGPSVECVNGLLSRGYPVRCKDYSTKRAARLAKSVRVWYPVPKEVGREVGWVEEPTTAYVRPVRRLAVRYRKPNGQLGVEVLITTVPMAEVFGWTGTKLTRIGEPEAELLATAHGYDQRGFGCETSFQGGKQGLGMGQRNKKRFAAQQMLMGLGVLAHNVLVWAKKWLLPAVPQLAKYGVKRLIRDVLGVLGRVEWDEERQVRRILLNAAHPLARPLLPGVEQRVATLGVAVVLGDP